MRWVVDAMNVIGSRPDGWWKDRHGAVVALVERLECWVEAHGHRVTVVLEHPPAQPIPAERVEIAHAPRASANSADDEIVRIVNDDERPGDIVVVTSDGALAHRVRLAGAQVRPSASFRSQIDPAPRAGG